VSTKRNYYDYEDLLLKTFFDIIKTGDLNLLKKDKKRIVGTNLEEIWESIIKRHNDNNGNFDFNNYVDAIRSYAYLLSEYMIIKACLLKLSMKLNYDVVIELNERGYVIDYTTPQRFRETLQAANSRSNNLVTKIISKQKEIEKYGTKGGKGAPLTFAKALMDLSGALGYSIPRDITLAEFDEGKKLIKKRHGRNNNTR
jgi:hypothetical protein